jgi:thioredoxin reductase
VYDVIVIGGGPAGLSAALVLGRQRRRVLVVDSGAPRNAPASEMHMYLGRDGAPPAGLLADGRVEATAYPTVELREGRVVRAAGEAGAFRVDLADGTVAEAARLLLATGQVDEPADVPGLAERWGRSVFHCPFCHGYESSGKTLAVIGGEVPQVMLGAYLADRYSDDVVVCTHGPHDLPAETTALLAARGIAVRTTPLAGIEGDLGALRLRFADGAVLDREAIFHRAPTRQHAGLAAALGCELLPDGCVRVDELGRTTVPGVAAAGDMARLEAVPDALTLVATGAADGVRAAVWMEQDLFRSGLHLAPATG